MTVIYAPLQPRLEQVEAALVIYHDLTDHELAAEALRHAQAQLAHMNRVTAMGQLAASIAHEVNQPIAAAITNAQAALRWLGARTPDLEEVRQALDRIVTEANRAGDVISRSHGLIQKAPPRKENLEINNAIREIIDLTHGETVKHGVSVQTQLAEDLPLVAGDRVQLQQVVLNLFINPTEAMGQMNGGPRELLISTSKNDSGSVLVAVADSGPGLALTNVEQIFDTFYTTKPSGLGMGLSICHSIIEAHEGRLWATANVPQGTIFQFTLPTACPCR
ncbi:MAG: hypothetical protein JOY71_03735 [Acetobacteraceae bacterium]|nr:hypothetical protein [Acetobacteraceae bacterium]MBV8521234.1 hypothetical protein [Acetobacteraceae bacterium]